MHASIDMESKTDQFHQTVPSIVIARRMNGPRKNLEDLLHERTREEWSVISKGARLKCVSGAPE